MLQMRQVKTVVDNTLHAYTIQGLMINTPSNSQTALASIIGVMQTNPAYIWVLLQN